MVDIWALTTASLVPSVVVGVVAYLGKLGIDRQLAKIDARSERLDTIATELRGASLGVKTKMREEERQAVVDFRIALERWEDYLHNAPFELGMADADKADVSALYAKDRDNVLAVKLALVKASVYLRDPSLESRLLDAIQNIHKTFYPIFNAGLMPVIAVQDRRRLMAQKLSAFEKSGNLALAPTQADLEEHKAANAQLTAALANFAAQSTKAYADAAPMLGELKAAINTYLYRPMEEAAVDKG